MKWTYFLIVTVFLTLEHCFEFAVINRPMCINTTTINVIVVDVDGVRLCVWTAATNGPFVHLQMICEYGEPRWNYVDR
jgi:hypothetical protein